LRPAASAVKRLAQSRELEVFQPESLQDEAARTRVAAARPDFLVVAAYGLILPQAVLDIPAHGALNIHASLLPRWRGAAPIQRALLAGDAETGITIMQMDAGLDTGPILLQQRIPIAADDDAQTLHEKLAGLGAQMIVAAVAEAAAGRARPVPQPEAGACYARKIGNREADIDWGAPAVQIERAVRAMRPSPGAAARLNGAVLKLWRARVADARGEPGRVLAAGPEGILVACGQDALLLEELQRAGGKRLQAAEFLRGVTVAPGARLE
jgi:methionyl-tRNA formyltransferase